MRSGEICCSKREIYSMMNSKGQRGNCIYNRQWELNSQYKGWLTAFKGDRKKALCKCCDRIIDVSNMGESALKSHMKSERHKNNSGSRQPMTLTSFGFVSCGNRDAAELGKVEKWKSGIFAIKTTTCNDNPSTASRCTYGYWFVDVTVQNM